MAQVAIRRGREHFPRTVKSVDELPEAVFRTLAQQHAAHDLKKLVVIPPQQYLKPRAILRRFLPFAWRWTPHRTLMFSDERILIIEGTDDATLNTITIPVEDIVAIQIDIVLLYSYFALSWTVEDRVEHCKIEFNAVELRLFEPGLQRIQQLHAAKLAHYPAAPPPVSTRQFPLKFHNYAQISMLPDETTRFALYQPALRQPGLPFSPYVAPNRTILLTEQHLIVLEDELPHISDFHGSQYRINRCFYPRSKVLGAHRDTHGGVDWLCVTLGMPDAHEERRFALRAEQIDDLLHAFETWFLRPNDA